MTSRTVWSTQLRSDLLSCTCTLTFLEEGSTEAEARHGDDYNERNSLVEDRRYWYHLEVDDARVSATLAPQGRTIGTSPQRPNEGVLDTRSQAGIVRLDIRLARDGETDTLTSLVDVLPAKFDLAAFRAMIEDICRHALSLALRLSASTALPLRVADRQQESGIVQRFFFIKHLLNNSDFLLALDQVTRNPHTHIVRETSTRSLSRARRLDARAIRALASGRDRVPVPKEHPLAKLGTLPRAGIAWQSVESLDTAENRFIRFALREFVGLLETISAICSRSKSAAIQRVAEETGPIEARLRHVLDHPTLREAGESTLLPLGSPVLHRRPGYREVLDAWLQVHIAASLHWEGGEDVFGAGRRDTDKLYEYWLFFQLLGMLSTDLGLTMPTADQFLSQTEQGLFLKVKAGRNFVHEGTTLVGARELHLKFSYNQRFNAATDESSTGSWSLTMQPDFTISCWPAEIDETVARELRLIVHLHFDAKYRLGEFNEDEGIATYQRDDIFVAHTYRDAIRRSGGAYILYPGNGQLPAIYFKHNGRIPSVGAFPVSPMSDGNAKGIELVGQLVREVLRELSEPNMRNDRVRLAAWSASQDRSGPQSTIAERTIVLVPQRNDLLPLQAQANRDEFVLRLGVNVEEGLRTLENWQWCNMLFFEENEGARAALVPLSFVQHGPTIASTFDPRLSLPEGVYAVVRLELDSAISLEARSASSFHDLRRFTSDYLGGCATRAVVRQFTHMHAPGTK